jgi:hypothetical protein
MQSPQFGVNNIYVGNQITASQPSARNAIDLTRSKRKYVKRFEKFGLFI